MTRTRIPLPAVVAAAIVLTVLALLMPGAVASVGAQTVPTITPTSPPQEPTATPDEGGPAPTTEPPPATSVPPSPTRPPAATSTRTTGSRATATPRIRPTDDPSESPTPLLSAAEAAWPTAEPCSDEPTVRVLSPGAWVYDGPGEEYDRMGRLAARTVRPLVARAADAEWWEIGLDDGESVWIADSDVSVQGDTSEVPVTAAPPLPDGATPTPGPTWDPTPNARCVTATATATATTTATVPPDTPTPRPSPAASDTPDASRVAATSTPEAETGTPLPEEDGSGNLFWLPVAGLVLLAAGAFLYATRRT